MRFPDCIPCSFCRTPKILTFLVSAAAVCSSRVKLTLSFPALSFNSCATSSTHYLASWRMVDGPTFTAAAALPSSHVAALRAATGIAVAGLKVIVDEAFRRQIRKEWEEDIRNANAAEAVRTIAEALPMTGEPVKGDFCSCVH